MGIYDAEDFTEEVADGGDFLVLTFLKSKNEYPGITSGTPVRVKSREHWFFKVEASRRITLRPYNAGQAVAAFNQAQNGTTRAYMHQKEGFGPGACGEREGEDLSGAAELEEESVDVRPAHRSAHRSGDLPKIPARR